MPQFTVGIPTFNRAHYLPYTLSCLMQQTFQDFEVVICDNASTDNTREIVEQFPDPRIRYFRQDTNVGPARNFYTCAEKARCDWFLIQQDDDVLCPYFLERCAAAIRKAPDIVMYAAEIMHSKDVTRLNGSTFGGFPLQHRWDQPQPRLIPGLQIAVLSWFMTGFMPPAQAFRTDLFRKHMPLGEDAVYLGDHYLTSHIACEGTVAFEGYAGAILRDHPQRLCVQLQDAYRMSRIKQCDSLLKLFAEKNLDWQGALCAILPELTLEFREATLLHYLGQDILPERVMDLLVESIAQERQQTPEQLVARLRADRLAAVRGGRLERLGMPRPMVRVIRGLLSAMGKKY